MRINTKLRDLYESHLEGLKQMYNQLDEQKVINYTAPYLLYVWEDDYLNSRRKVMIIGQETDGWNDIYVRNRDDINGVIETYKDFDYGRNYYNSPLWKYVRKINKMINGDETLPHAVIINNLNKFGKSDGKGRPETIVTKLENKYFNIMREEINILQPDACIFLTGPNYDDDIKAKFPDVQFTPISGYPMRKLAKLTASGLPLAFRTYHPGFGQRRDSDKRYTNMLSLISEEIRQMR